MKKEKQEEYICDLSDGISFYATGDWDLEATIIVEFKDGTRAKNEYSYVYVKDNKLYGIIA